MAADNKPASLASKDSNLSATEREVSEKATSTDVDPEAQRGEDSVPEDPKSPPREISGWKWFLVVLAIYSSQFLFALDNTIVANVQPVIVSDFKSVEKLPWISVAFLIGAAGTNLIWGKVFGQFNAKWTYILSVFVFEVGSAVCGAAPNMNALIIGRAICGVSGSGMYVGLMTLLAATTTIHERPMYVGGGGFIWGVGTVLGPIIGGAFTDSSAGWRWAFYINLCVGAVCAPVYLFLLPNKDPRPGVSLRERANTMDHLGGILTIGAMVTGVMAVSFGGVMYPWNSGRIIGLFCCSGVLFILLGLQQVFTIFTSATHRVLPVEFFKSRTVLILFAATAAGGTAIFVPVYMAPLYFQFTRGDSTLESGVRLLPFIILMIVAVMANGALLSSFGLYMPWYLVGGILVVIGGALMYTVGLTTSVAHVYGYTVLIGVGVGFFAQASFSVAQATVAPELVPSAVGFISLAQITGITLALAIANAVFFNESVRSLRTILPGVDPEHIKETISGTRSELFQSLTPRVREQVLEALVDALSKSYILVMTAGALVAVLSLLMKREKLFLAPSGGS
ncbi:putative HC-toxin efflux carrier TOXA [Aspergillus udagawae]|uniref:HC-toxin efflux carrier TOXA n=1 Tax=Aspergillus udagawae TaxID=91492 RepID=A0ABQ1B3M9_9EURO|nr:putative HC-toxin efflux carrier TOXA [Aspergillus udagawae]GFF93151.1 putative HC-toxin efflux carrier TOXA [Aspergillus udagawae]GFG09374.1 putative HC-toxin efflux carrier TOXA [Aspergillus udagawae]GFG26214.1 putative HC-toxin efflux carrier TOXA [Aspergillus udagawae]